MNTRLACALVAALTSPVLAQGHLTTPPVDTERDGGDATFGFGWRRQMGARIVDDTHANGTRLAIKRISFRADYRDHESSR